MDTQKETPKKRAPRLAVQLQRALAHADALTKVKAKDKGESYVSEMKLVTARIKTLTLLVNRKRGDQFRKLNDELKAQNAEIGRLKGELAAALAAKPEGVVQEKTIVQRVEVPDTQAANERDALREGLAFLAVTMTEGDKAKAIVALYDKDPAIAEAISWAMRYDFRNVTSLMRQNLDDVKKFSQAHNHPISFLATEVYALRTRAATSRPESVEKPSPVAQVRLTDGERAIAILERLRK